ncbi:MAG TPA: fibronectin type III domain-containing protein [Solirubrobacteraceae bacterium]|nr:fibronectin type III domain-containing protein [Solirubrobacteraceae bacterium]
MKLKPPQSSTVATIAGALGRLALALTACAALAGSCSSGAEAAAPPPTVHTGAAEQVGFGSATLTGHVEPHGSNTSYYFQYGPTAGYGEQTAVAEVTGNVTSQAVSVAISGLAPITTYHYRVIAVNAGGASTGADRTLKTTKVPLSLQILVSPNPTLFGGSATVQGTLSGTENANRAVVLQDNAFPYTAGFANVGNPELTSTSGSFSFAVLSLTTATQFRVATTTETPVVSPIATEGVAVQVSAHIARARGRHRVRVYGTVSPAVNGMEVAIMRIVRGTNVRVAGAILHARNAGSSRFSRVLRVRPGLYRVFAQITNGSLTSNSSTPLLIR